MTTGPQASGIAAAGPVHGGFDDGQAMVAADLVLPIRRNLRRPPALWPVNQYEVGVAHPAPVRARVVQVGGELVEAVGDTRDRARVGPAPGGRELPRATLGPGNRRGTRLDVLADVEDLPEVSPDGVLVDLGDLGDTVAGPMHLMPKSA